MKITVSVSPTTISYMTSQFRWGFELEAYINGKHTLPDIKKILDDQFQMTGLGVSTDASLPSIRRSTAFEYQSPVLDITPTSLKKIGTGLATLGKLDVYVTDRCGFHTHFSHPSLSENDRKWILMGVAMDEEAVAKLTEFEGIPFWDAEYADRAFLEGLARVVQIGGDIHKLLRDEKYRLIRLHPQGTLEWRGPRNFLDKADPRICMKYVSRVREVASIFNEKLEAKEVGGKTRKEWGLSVAKRPHLDVINHRSKFHKSMDVQNIVSILRSFPWLQKSDFKEAVVEIDDHGKLIWNGGTWNKGVWEDGTWNNGVWNDGTWNNGVWNDGTWNNGVWEGGTWNNGTWKTGWWDNGTWEDGTWNGGTWNGGTWNNGTWNNGTWNDGEWSNGTWNDGVWKGGIWMDGTWNGGT